MALEPPQDVESPRVQRVATQLVAGEDGAIEHAHRDAATREQQRRQRTGRSRSRDQDVGRRHG